MTEERFIMPDSVFVTEAEITQVDVMDKLFRKTAKQAKQQAVDKDYLKVLQWQEHPELFMYEALQFTPWVCSDADDQLDIIHAIRDYPRVTVRSGNGVGKTAVSARIAVWFLTCFPGSIVITTAPTTRQVEKLLWGEIRRAYKGAEVPLGGEVLNTEIRLDELWYAMGFSTDEPEKFQGFHAPYILIIVDEASGVTEPIYEAIEGILTSENARLLLIGNPTNPVGYFGRTFLHPRESKGWKHLHISCYNSPNVRAKENLIPALCRHDWPEEKRKVWGEYNPFFQVRCLGNFPETGEDCLVPYHMVHSALERSIPPAGNKILSVDVARFGNDASVIGRLWGAQFRILKRFWNLDGPALANRIIEQAKLEANKDATEIKVDVIGWGASCFDHLKYVKKKGSSEEQRILKNMKLTPVNVSEKSRSKKARKDYKNIRAEAGFIVRGMFEEGEIDIDSEDLAMQATNLTYKFQEGRYILERKADYKDRMNMSSPDELDSLLIAKAIVSKGVPNIY